MNTETTVLGELNRTSKEKFNQYIIDCIDSEGYGVKAASTDEKLSFLASTFIAEYGYPDNLKRYGTYVNTFANWIMGLPSSFNIAFENSEILELGVRFGALRTKATEAQKDKFLASWFTMIALKTFTLFYEHGVNVNMV